VTSEQIQQAIEGMLAVQRQLQDSQLKLVERQEVFMTELELMKERSDALDQRFAATDRRFEQLIGYSINRERDSLDIQQDILNLRHRVVALERRLTES
jgi:hypothetical protein